MDLLGNASPSILSLLRRPSESSAATVRNEIAKLTRISLTWILAAIAWSQLVPAPVGAQPFSRRVVQYDQTRIGASENSVRTDLGTPWFVAYQGGLRYLVYNVAKGHAWFVVATSHDRVVSKQVLSKAHDHANATGPLGIALGSPTSVLRRARGKVMIAGELDFPQGNGISIFFGNRSGRIDRFGASKTLEGSRMPAVIRWYQSSGWTADRAVPPSIYGGSQKGEVKYLASLHSDEIYQCLGGNTWREVSRRPLEIGGISLIRARIECGLTRSFATIFFASTEGAARSLLVERPGERAKAPNLASTSTPAIWFTTANGTRFTGNLAPHFAFTYNLASPPTGITLNYVSNATAAALSAGKSASSAVGCSYILGPGNTGSGKCEPTQPADGTPCQSLTMSTASGNYQSNTECVAGASDPSKLPREPNCQAGKGAGAPIDVVSGELTYMASDFSLSGPFGLSFMHFYDSLDANTTSDLGYGWSQPYDDNLNLTNAATYGMVTHNTPTCQRRYFGGLTSSAPSYDSFSGDALTMNSNGTYTLTTWDDVSQIYNSSGKLQEIIDRVGNTQTLARNGSGQVTGITDVLGRSISFTYDSSSRIKTITSTPAGISMALTYDTNPSYPGCHTGELCQITESDGTIWNFEYEAPTSDGFHLLQAVIDPLGNIAELNTFSATPVNLGNGDDHYRVTQQGMQGGVNVRTFSYTTGGTSISDSATPARLTSYAWDQLLQEYTNVAGYECRCGGASVGVTTDTFSRQIQLSQPGLVTQQLTYGRDQLYTSPDGLETYIATAYPGATTVAYPNVLTINGNQTRVDQFQYYPVTDPRRDLTNVLTQQSVVVAQGTASTTYTYSTNGLLLSVTRAGYVPASPSPMPTTLTYTYSYDTEGHGRVISIVTPRNAETTTFTYFSDTLTDLDARGQLSSVENAKSQTTQFAAAPSPNNTYTIYGKPLSSIDPNGVTRIFSYDLLGRLKTSTVKGTTDEPGDLTTSVSYDADGRLQSVTRPLGNAFTLSYDPVGNETAMTMLDKNSLQHERMFMTYDAGSQNTEIQSELCPTPATACAAWSSAASRSFVYDSNGNPKTDVFPTTGTKAYTWNNLGNLSDTVLGNAAYSIHSNAGYDGQHQLVSDGVGSGFAQKFFTHDLQGNLDSVGSSGLSETHYTYDDFSRVVGMQAPYTGSATYVYDADGNIITYVDGNGASTGTTYDALDRPMVATSSRTGLTQEVVTRTYDSTTSGFYGIGRLATMTDPSGTSTYAYERRGHVQLISQTLLGVAYSTKYVYDANDNATTTTLPSTRVLSYQYDFADRQSSVSAGGTTYVTSATYEPFGPLLQMQYGNGTTASWTFDQRYLPLELKVTGSTTLYDAKYVTNGPGFVTSVADQLTPSYDSTFAYGGNATNALTSSMTGSSLWGSASYLDSYAQSLVRMQLGTNNSTFVYSSANRTLQSVYNVNSGVSTPITFDSAGNETSDGSSVSTYSPRDALATADGVSYVYDGFGRRVSSTFSGTQARYFYGRDLQLQTEIVSSSPTVTHDYIWLGGVPVAQTDSSGSSYWTVVDNMRRPFLQTNAAGGIYWQADYEPYGSIFDVRTSGTPHQPLRGPGEEAEMLTPTSGPNGSTGRYYNGYRWYRPTLARYTQPDPAGLSLGSFNLYSYAANNPVTYSDPLGLCLIDVRYHWINKSKYGKVAQYFIEQGAIHGTLTLTENSNVSGCASQGNNVVAYDAEPQNESNDSGPLTVTRYSDFQNDPNAQGVRDADSESPASEQNPHNVVSDSLPCRCYDQALRARMNAINALGVPYNPVRIFGYDSDAALWELLDSIGHAGDSQFSQDDDPRLWLSGYQPIKGIDHSRTFSPSQYSCQ